MLVSRRGSWLMRMENQEKKKKRCWKLTKHDFSLWSRVMIEILSRRKTPHRERVRRAGREREGQQALLGQTHPTQPQGLTGQRGRRADGLE